MSGRITHCRTCQHELGPSDWRAMTCERCKSALGNPPTRYDGITIAVPIVAIVMAWAVIGFYLTMSSLRG